MKSENWLELWLWIHLLVEDEDKPTGRNRGPCLSPLSQGTVSSEGTKTDGEDGGVREREKERGRELTHRLVLCGSCYNYLRSIGPSEWEGVRMEEGKGKDEGEKKSFQAQRGERSTLSSVIASYHHNWKMTTTALSE